MSKPSEPLDLASIRARLVAASGRPYWRSLEEIAGTEGFQEFLHREFPRQASEWEDPAGRRNFLKLMGASLALAGLSACTRQPRELIMPYVRPPEELIPGKPLFYATAMPLSGAAIGLLVESHEGRPTKIEGHPEHPASLGASDAFTQASILSLYDPDRSQALTYLSEIRSWGSFLGSLREALAAQQEKRGAGLRILTETVCSPALASQLKGILAGYPDAKWHQYEPAGAHSARAGSRLAFGEAVNTYYQIDQADVILSLDSDFLASGPASLRYARQFAARRRVRGDSTNMNRLYMVESTPSATGGKADHRLPLRPSEIESFTAVLASALEGQSAGDHPQARWIAAVARDLQAHRGASVILPGDQQSPAVHALAHWMNQQLGNAGKTVVHTEPLEAGPGDQIESLRDLARDLDVGSVELLVIIGGNPVYNAPADLSFGDRLLKAKLRIHLGLYDDETSELCQWHVPESHYLEAWSDARAFDGTASVQQPLIAPLYGGRSAHELLAAFTDQPERSGYDIVRDYWKPRAHAADFESWWRKAVHDGVIPGTALARKTVSAKRVATSRTAAQPIEIAFRPDPHIYDGRFANNGWLQELPKPLTKLTWDNAALVSPATAERLGLSNEDEVELRYQGRSVRAPIWIVPGHAKDAVTAHLGYGRKRAGRVGTGTGFNAYSLRTSGDLWDGAGVEIRKTGRKYRLATTQEHQSMEGRHLVREAGIEEYRKNPNFAHEGVEEPPRELTLYPEVKYEGHAWGMAIDLSACVGCNACVVACQAENNIPVVGKAQVIAGREMHWLRVDRYYEGGLDNPATHYQPVICMHCENAPCEVVCPVAATVHSSEGLNDMVYNRCVGTRYCSNNCPYKVRRFNFLLYSDFTTPSLQLMRNPNVTVRSRGVMEKCTYCVQRINFAKIEAEKEDRPVRDGEIVTACQGACPTEAIIFGDINDPASHVARLKAEKLNYLLLGELNTRPRTSYLAGLRNPNPELETA